MANTPFDYNLLITGDCQSSASGSISIQFTGGTPPYTVNWISPNLGIDYTTTQFSTRTGLVAGTYVLNVIDSSVPDNQSFNINIPVSSGVCISVTNIFPTTCDLNNGSVIATSTSDYSSTSYYLYDYSGNTIQSAVTNSAQVEFVGLSAGTYSVGVEDLGGCTGITSNFIIEDSSAVDFGFYLVPNSACNQDADLGKIYITGLTGTPPYTFFWSNSQTGSTITGLTSGIYSVTVTDSNSCSTTKTTTLTDVDPLGFGSFSAITPSCFSNDGVLYLNITGGTAPYYYSASTGDVEISYSQTFVLSGISAGYYNISVTDAALCKQLFGTEILTPKSIGTVTVTTTNSNCSSTDGSITISVSQGSPPYTYTLTYPDTSIESVASEQSIYAFQNLSGGSYTINVTDLTGCAYNESLTLSATSVFTISTEVTGTTCSLNNGSVLVTKSSGGTSPFSYSIDNQILYPQTSLTAVTFSNLSAGSHLITVTDFTGCSQTTSVIVSNSNPLEFGLVSTSCGSGSDGTITAFISSGLAPFTFYWSDNVVANPQQITVSGLTAGTYSLTIVDSNNCIQKKQTSITCTQNYNSYQTYTIASDTLDTVEQTQFGMLQMLNDGFNDLTNDNEGCLLISTVFVALVSALPIGYSGSSSFYTGYTLNDVPSDNLWYNTVEYLLLQIPGIIGVEVDPFTNAISIKTNPLDPNISSQVINIDLKILYNIDCQQ